MVPADPQEVPVQRETTAVTRKEVTGADDFQSVINHHRDGTADHPGTNQEAYNNQNENSRHRLGKLSNDGIHNVIPGIAQINGNYRRHRRGYQHQNLRA